jgi:hypothetical protein
VSRTTERRRLGVSDIDESQRGRTERKEKGNGAKREKDQRTIRRCEVSRSRLRA